MTTEEKEKNITPEEWLARGKWTKFLMSLPFGQTTVEMEKVGEYSLQILRVTASGLTNSADCQRTFSVTVDNSRKYFTVKVERKK